MLGQDSHAASRGRSAGHRDWNAVGRPRGSWFYREVWRKAKPLVTHDPPPRVCVVGAETTLGSALCEAIAASGSVVLRVVQSTGVMPAVPGEFIVDNTSAAGYERLIERLVSTGVEWVICDLRSCMPLDESPERGGQQVDDMLIGLLYLVQAMVKQSKPAIGLRLACVTANGQAVSGDEADVSIAGAAAWGFAKSLSLEAPQLCVRCIDVNPTFTAAAVLARELSVTDEGPTAWRATGRFRQTIEEVLPETMPPRRSWAVGGTYLITGGLGGLGLVLAEWLAQRYRPTLILLGRSQSAPGSTAAATIERIRELGAAVHVLQADVGDPESMMNLERSLRSICDCLDGVIHLAGVLEDIYVRNMGPDALSHVLRAKVRGSLLLWQHTRELRPREFILFSSLSGFTGSPGQANYAAANGFLGGFAHWLKRQGQSALAIDWGYWGERGVAADELHAFVLARSRVFPMRTEDALAAFETTVRVAPERLIVANVGTGFFAPYGIDQGLLSVIEHCERTPTDKTQRATLSQYQSFSDKLEPLCALLVYGVLQRSGLFGAGAEGLTVEEAFLRLHGTTPRRRQFEWLIAMLTNEGLLVAEEGRYLRSAQVVAGVAEELTACLQSEYHFAESSLALLSRCCAALVDVIRGQVSPLSVLFPDGSLTFVGDFYSHSPVHARANLLAASAAKQVAATCAQPVRVLEVGAGTGALTAALLPTISVRMESYLATDVEATFIPHLRNKFANCAVLSTGIFDLDIDPLTQGLATGTFDLIVAANVLHATPDVRRSIEHVRSLLTVGGFLILVETVLPSRFADCTFGLLDGWWSYRDLDLRGDYPLLTTGQWQALLHDGGFREGYVPVKLGSGLTNSGVCILIAEKVGADASDSQ